MTNSTKIIELRVDATGIATQEEAERQNRLPNKQVSKSNSHDTTKCGGLVHSEDFYEQYIDDYHHHYHHYHYTRNQTIKVPWRARDCTCGGGTNKIGQFGTIILW